METYVYDWLENFERRSVDTTANLFAQLTDFLVELPLVEQRALSKKSDNSCGVAVSLFHA